MASINVDFAVQTENRKVRDYFFKDLAIPLKFSNNQYDLKDLKDDESVKNSLRNIFTFKKGERILNPDFGNPLYPFIYEKLDENFKNNITGAIINAINKWEPRIEVLNVIVEHNEDQNETYITVNYAFKYRKLTGSYNLVVT